MGENPIETKRIFTPLKPVLPVLFVEGGEVKTLEPTQISSARVGHKAFGLASMPSAWTTPFFCVSGDVLPETKALNAAMGHLGLRSGRRVLVRSSGVTESLENRGELETGECNSDELLAEITRLQNAIGGGPVVHWVVQEQLECSAKGHLSNERRIAQDKRDWVVEFEVGVPNVDLHKIPLRKWRDKRVPAVIALSCLHKESIVDALRIVAKWAYERLMRVHFEWVWDGRQVHIVQADPCEEISRGVDPHSLVKNISTKSNIGSLLESFRPASQVDFDVYRKLANAKVYQKLKYKEVPFFVLDNQIEIDSIIRNGCCSKVLKQDLERLTVKPLVIRTDGKDTPAHLREMLPRSDELRSAEAAEKWLVNEFRHKVNQCSDSGECLANFNLCLIAHHFVPAAASAWCQALPDQRRVRIESLWGIPEGLYWYAYDVFDVDTQVPSISADSSKPEVLPFREKSRYKEHFVAPNDEGAWVVHRTSARADWARSITRRDWIEEIAWTSRCIAAKEGRPVVVMWLIDTAPKSTPHRVLPWFHMEWKQDGPIHKVSPRKKQHGSRDVILQSRADWDNLKVAIGGGVAVSRIRVDPRESEMVRDQEFVKGLAQLAKDNRIVVELSGGILSHAYYMLSGAGCQVECADLDDFAVDQEAIEFNKLVRDGIPSEIVSRGEEVAVVRVRGEALITALRRKLIEECFEVLDAKTNDQIAEELADVREVSLRLMAELGIEESTVELARKEKFKKRGSFKEGLMLKRTLVSSSLGRKAGDNEVIANENDGLLVDAISRSIELPSSASEDLHVDLRYDSNGLGERQLTAILPAHLSGFLPPKALIELKTQDDQPHEMILELELERHNADLRLKIRLKNAPQQLLLDLQ